MPPPKRGTRSGGGNLRPATADPITGTGPQQSKNSTLDRYVAHPLALLAQNEFWLETVCLVNKRMRYFKQGQRIFFDDFEKEERGIHRSSKATSASDRSGNAPGNEKSDSTTGSNDNSEPAGEACEGNNSNTAGNNAEGQKNANSSQELALVGEKTRSESMNDFDPNVAALILSGEIGVVVEEVIDESKLERYLQEEKRYAKAVAKSQNVAKNAAAQRAGTGVNGQKNNGTSFSGTITGSTSLPINGLAGNSNFFSSSSNAANNGSTNGNTNLVSATRFSKQRFVTAVSDDPNVKGSNNSTNSAAQTSQNPQIPNSRAKFASSFRERIPVARKQDMIQVITKNERILGDFADLKKQVEEKEFKLSKQSAEKRAEKLRRKKSKDWKDKIALSSDEEDDDGQCKIDGDLDPEEEIRQKKELIMQNTVRENDLVPSKGVPVLSFLRFDEARAYTRKREAALSLRNASAVDKKGNAGKTGGNNNADGEESTTGADDAQNLKQQDEEDGAQNQNHDSEEEGTASFVEGKYGKIKSKSVGGKDGRGICFRGDTCAKTQTSSKDSMKGREGVKAFSNVGNDLAEKSGIDSSTPSSKKVKGGRGSNGRVLNVNANIADGNEKDSDGKGSNTTNTITPDNNSLLRMADTSLVTSTADSLIDSPTKFKATKTGHSFGSNKADTKFDNSGRLDNSGNSGSGTSGRPHRADDTLLPSRNPWYNQIDTLLDEGLFSENASGNGVGRTGTSSTANDTTNAANDSQNDSVIITVEDVLEAEQDRTTPGSKAAKKKEISQLFRKLVRKNIKRAVRPIRLAAKEESQNASGVLNGGQNASMGGGAVDAFGRDGLRKASSASAAELLKNRPGSASTLQNMPGETQDKAKSKSSTNKPGTSNQISNQNQVQAEQMNLLRLADCSGSGGEKGSVSFLDPSLNEDNVAPLRLSSCFRKQLSDTEGQDCDSNQTKKKGILVTTKVGKNLKANVADINTDDIDHDTPVTRLKRGDFLNERCLLFPEDYRWIDEARATGTSKKTLGQSSKTDAWELVADAESVLNGDNESSTDPASINTNATASASAAQSSDSVPVSLSTRRPLPTKKRLSFICTSPEGCVICLLSQKSFFESFRNFLVYEKEFSCIQKVWRCLNKSLIFLRQTRVFLDFVSLFSPKVTRYRAIGDGKKVSVVEQGEKGDWMGLVLDGTAGVEKVVEELEEVQKDTQKDTQTDANLNANSVGGPGNSITVDGRIVVEKSGSVSKQKEGQGVEAVQEQLEEVEKKIERLVGVADGDEAGENSEKSKDACKKDSSIADKDDDADNYSDDSFIQEDETASIPDVESEKISRKNSVEKESINTDKNSKEAAATLDLAKTMLEGSLARRNGNGNGKGDGQPQRAKSADKNNQQIVPVTRKPDPSKSLPPAAPAQSTTPQETTSTAKSRMPNPSPKVLSRVKHLGNLTSGDAFGDLTLFGISRRQASIRVGKDGCEIARIEHRQVYELLDQYFPSERSAMHDTAEEIINRYFLSGNTRNSEFRNLRVFRKCSSKFLDVLESGLAYKVIRPGTVMFRELTETDGSMYVLHLGSCDVFIQGAKIATLEEGAYFGEQTALSASKIATATIVTASLCLMQVLPKEAVQKAKKACPQEVKEIFEDAGRKRMEERFPELKNMSLSRLPMFKGQLTFSTICQLDGLGSGFQMYLPGQVLKDIGKRIASTTGATDRKALTNDRIFFLYEGEVVIVGKDGMSQAMTVKAPPMRTFGRGLNFVAGEFSLLSHPWPSYFASVQLVAKSLCYVQTLDVSEFRPTIHKNLQDIRVFERLAGKHLIGQDRAGTKGTNNGTGGGSALSFANNGATGTGGATTSSSATSLNNGATNANGAATAKKVDFAADSKESPTNKSPANNQSKSFHKHLGVSQTNAQGQLIVKKSKLSPRPMSSPSTIQNSPSSQKRNKAGKHGDSPSDGMHGDSLIMALSELTDGNEEAGGQNLNMDVAGAERLRGIRKGATVTNSSQRSNSAKQNSKSDSTAKAGKRPSSAKAITRRSNDAEGDHPGSKSNEEKSSSHFASGGPLFAKISKPSLYLDIPYLRLSPSRFIFTMDLFAGRDVFYSGDLLDVCPSRRRFGVKNMNSDDSNNRRQSSLRPGSAADGINMQRDSNPQDVRIDSWLSSLKRGKATKGSKPGNMIHSLLNSIPRPTTSPALGQLSHIGQNQAKFNQQHKKAASPRFMPPVHLMTPPQTGRKNEADEDVKNPNSATKTSTPGTSPVKKTYKLKAKLDELSQKTLLMRNRISKKEQNEKRLCNVMMDCLAESRRENKRMKWQFSWEFFENNKAVGAVVGDKAGAGKTTEDANAGGNTKADGSGDKKKAAEKNSGRNLDLFLNTMLYLREENQAEENADSTANGVTEVTVEDVVNHLMGEVKERAERKEQHDAEEKGDVSEKQEQGTEREETVEKEGEEKKPFAEKANQKPKKTEKQPEKKKNDIAFYIILNGSARVMINREQAMENYLKDIKNQVESAKLAEIQAETSHNRKKSKSRKRKHELASSQVEILESVCTGIDRAIELHRSASGATIARTMNENGANHNGNGGNSDGTSANNIDSRRSSVESIDSNLSEFWMSNDTSNISTGTASANNPAVPLVHNVPIFSPDEYPENLSRRQSTGDDTSDINLIGTQLKNPITNMKLINDNGANGLPALPAGSSSGSAKIQSALSYDPKVYHRRRSIEESNLNLDYATRLDHASGDHWDCLRMLDSGSVFVTASGVQMLSGSENEGRKSPANVRFDDGSNFSNGNNLNSALNSTVFPETADDKSSSTLLLASSLCDVIKVTVPDLQKMLKEFPSESTRLKEILFQDGKLEHEYVKRQTSRILNTYMGWGEHNSDDSINGELDNSALAKLGRQGAQMANFSLNWNWSGKWREVWSGLDGELRDCRGDLGRLAEKENDDESESEDAADDAEEEKKKSSNPDKKTRSVEKAKADFFKNSGVIQTHENNIEGLNNAVEDKDDSEDSDASSDEEPNVNPGEQAVRRMIKKAEGYKITPGYGISREEFERKVQNDSANVSLDASSSMITTSEVEGKNLKKKEIETSGYSANTDGNADGGNESDFREEDPNSYHAVMKNLFEHEQCLEDLRDLFIHEDHLIPVSAGRKRNGLQIETASPTDLIPQLKLDGIHVKECERQERQQKIKEQHAFMEKQNSLAPARKETRSESQMAIAGSRPESVNSVNVSRSGSWPASTTNADDTSAGTNSNTRITPPASPEESEEAEMGIYNDDTMSDSGESADGLVHFDEAEQRTNRSWSSQNWANQARYEESGPNATETTKTKKPSYRTQNRKLAGILKKDAVPTESRTVSEIRRDWNSVGEKKFTKSPLKKRDSGASRPQTSPTAAGAAGNSHSITGVGQESPYKTKLTMCWPTRVGEVEIRNKTNAKRGESGSSGSRGASGRIQNGNTRSGANSAKKKMGASSNSPCQENNYHFKSDYIIPTFQEPKTALELETETASGGFPMLLNAAGGSAPNGHSRRRSLHDYFGSDGNDTDSKKNAETGNQDDLDELDDIEDDTTKAVDIACDAEIARSIAGAKAYTNFLLDGLLENIEKGNTKGSDKQASTVLSHAQIQADSENPGRVARPDRPDSVSASASKQSDNLFDLPQSNHRPFSTDSYSAQLHHEKRNLTQYHPNGETASESVHNFRNLNSECGMKMSIVDRKLRKALEFADDRQQKGCAVEGNEDDEDHVLTREELLLRNVTGTLNVKKAHKSLEAREMESKALESMLEKRLEQRRQKFRNQLENDQMELDNGGMAGSNIRIRSYGSMDSEFLVLRSGTAPAQMEGITAENFGITGEFATNAESTFGAASDHFPTFDKSTDFPSPIFPAEGGDGEANHNVLEIDGMDEMPSLCGSFAFNRSTRSPKKENSNGMGNGITSDFSSPARPRLLTSPSRITNTRASIRNGNGRNVNGKNACGKRKSKSTGVTPLTKKNAANTSDGTAGALPNNQQSLSSFMTMGSDVPKLQTNAAGKVVGITSTNPERRKELNAISNSLSFGEREFQAAKKISALEMVAEEMRREAADAGIVPGSSKKLKKAKTTGATLGSNRNRSSSHHRKQVWSLGQGEAPEASKEKSIRSRSVSQKKNFKPDQNKPVTCSWRERSASNKAKKKIRRGDVPPGDWLETGDRVFQDLVCDEAYDVETVESDSDDIAVESVCNSISSDHVVDTRNEESSLIGPEGLSSSDIMGRAVNGWEREQKDFNERKNDGSAGGRIVLKNEGSAKKQTSSSGRVLRSLSTGSNGRHVHQHPLFHRRFSNHKSWQLSQTGMSGQEAEGAEESDNHKDTVNQNSDEAQSSQTLQNEMNRNATPCFGEDTMPSISVSSPIARIASASAVFAGQFDETFGRFRSEREEREEESDEIKSARLAESRRVSETREPSEAQGNSETRYWHEIGMFYKVDTNTTNGDVCKKSISFKEASEVSSAMDSVGVTPKKQTHLTDSSEYDKSDPVTAEENATRLRKMATLLEPSPERVRWGARSESSDGGADFFGKDFSRSTFGLPNQNTRNASPSKNRSRPSTFPSKLGSLGTYNNSNPSGILLSQANTQVQPLDSEFGLSPSPLISRPVSRQQEEKESKGWNSSTVIVKSDPFLEKALGRVKKMEAEEERKKREQFKLKIKQQLVDDENPIDTFAMPLAGSGSQMRDLSQTRSGKSPSKRGMSGSRMSMGASGKKSKSTKRSESATLMPEHQWRRSIDKECGLMGGMMLYEKQRPKSNAPSSRPCTRPGRLVATGPGILGSLSNGNTNADTKSNNRSRSRPQTSPSAGASDKNDILRRNEIAEKLRKCGMQVDSVEKNVERIYQSIGDIRDVVGNRNNSGKKQKPREKRSRSNTNYGNTSTGSKSHTTSGIINNVKNDPILQNAQNYLMTQSISSIGTEKSSGLISGLPSRRNSAGLLTGPQPTSLFTANATVSDVSKYNDSDATSSPNKHFRAVPCDRRKVADLVNLTDCKASYAVGGSSLGAGADSDFLAEYPFQGLVKGEEEGEK